MCKLYTGFHIETLYATGFWIKIMVVYSVIYSIYKHTKFDYICIEYKPYSGFHLEALYANVMWIMVVYSVQCKFHSIQAEENQKKSYKHCLQT